MAVPLAALRRRDVVRSRSFPELPLDYSPPQNKILLRWWGCATVSCIFHMAVCCVGRNFLGNCRTTKITVEMKKKFWPNKHIVNFLRYNSIEARPQLVNLPIATGVPMIRELPKRWALYL